MEKRRWYLDAALIVLIAVLSVLVYFRLEAVFAPEREEPDPTETAAPTISATQDGETVKVEFDATAVSSKTATDFELQNLSGETVSLTDFLGQPVLINFWATWCPPCTQEMPLLQATADQYLEELVVLAINGGDTEEQIGAFADANGYDMMFLADPENAVAPEYLVRGFPTSFFIDPEGLIQAIHVGMLDETLLLGYLAEIGVAE